MQFASVRVITDDLDGMTAFYERLTRTEARRPAPVFAEIVTGGIVLALAAPVTVASLGDGAPSPRAAGSAIVEFLVDDVDAEFERLQPAAEAVVLPPTTMPWGNRSTILRDPDGNLVNLFSRPAPE
ncbi:VOC family protein [Curtobacterium sp. ISL-83]|uniref:VOC family protein n=1 Tax=Curtobacterium sp. ISL-83 TaxID=2819145 RepID=UPI001BE8CCDF|nr:VOC family protein [Curtobacterium sp. ISL-83]MBT2503630.1 VOC family protein [Curtobacterium sp. ISL-83]